MIYTRIVKASKENPQIKDLRAIAKLGQTTQIRRRRTNADIKFIEKILEFFNFNICLAKRDPESYERMKILINCIPSFKEISEVLKLYSLDDNVLYYLFLTNVI